MQVGTNGFYAVYSGFNSKIYRNNNNEYKITSDLRKNKNYEMIILDYVVYNL